MAKENAFDSGVEEYETWFKINDQLFASELEAVRQLLPTEGRGIEIGVGTGIFASALSISQGVEPSDNMAAKAVERGIKVIEGVAEDLPLEDHSFDFVTMITADCFLDDIGKALVEIGRILNQKGTLVIAFLDRETTLGQVYDKNKHLSKSYQKAHFHSGAEMAELLIKADFQIVDQRQTIFTLENIFQAPEPGIGEGLFGVIKAVKR